MPEILEHMERMLNLRTNGGMLPVLLPLRGREWMTDFRTVGHGVEDPALPRRSFVFFFAVRLVSEDGAFLPCEKFAKHRDVGNFRGGGFHGMHETGICIDADMPLHAEVPLIALLRLTHLGVALPFLVFR